MIKFKLYSRYDEVDALKTSADSSILNKEYKNKGTNVTGLTTVVGAGLGAMKGKSKFGKMGKGITGAAAGALIGMGANALSKANETRKANNFYDSRLREAKRAAKRREKIDWNERIHGRSSYE